MIKAAAAAVPSGVLVLLAAAVLVAGCGGNSLRTSESASPEDLVGSPLALLGLRADPDEEEIVYRPRSPLVMPGEAELRPPEERVADNGPDWPDDPDVRARRVRAEMRRAAAEESVRDVEYASEPMSRAELDEWGQRYGRIDDSAAAPAPPPGETVRVLAPEELGEDDDAAARTAMQEPPRRRLTDPPAGYRRPAETAEMPAEEDGLLGGVLGRGGSERNESFGRRTDPTKDF